MRRTRFDQSSPVQPVSESRGGPLSVTDGRTKEILVSNIGCLCIQTKRLVLTVFFHQGGGRHVARGGRGADHAERGHQQNHQAPPQVPQGARVLGPAHVWRAGARPLSHSGRLKTLSLS